MPVIDVTDDTFDELVVNAKGPVLVEFWAEWCGPCKMLSPILEEIASEHPELTLAKIDTDAEVATASRFAILAVPTMLLFHRGEAVSRVTGARPKRQVLAMLSDVLQPAGA